MSKPFEEYMIRPCGGGYQYCNGHCTDCEMVKDITTSTSTVYKAHSDDDGISRPTQEMYMKSLEAKRSLAEWIRLSRKRQNQLLDDLFKERSLEKDYQGMYDAHKDLVRRYEIYQEIRNDK